MQAEHSADFCGATQLELSQPVSLFDPAKHLLNPAEGVHRLLVALVTCSAALG